jgi:pimeloyl-ACP methyl ester carboxylesterase
MRTTNETVTSADGTTIALERSGDGPPVVLVGGAFNDRTTVAGLAATLAPQFTAVAYDRRGRGDSSDRGSGGSDSDAVQREIEDMVALIDHLGGSASVFGHSSGANLAIEAAERGLSIQKLAVYEPAFVPEGSRPRPAADVFDRLRELLGEGRRDDAAVLFLIEQVGVPAEMVEGMRASESWGWLTGLAHSLPYDVAVCGPGCVLPVDRLATIQVPTLAIDGGESPDWMRGATRAVAEAIPGARYVTLEGQDHGVLNQPEALHPVLLDFLG